MMLNKLIINKLINAFTNWLKLVPELNVVELIYISFGHYKYFSEDKVIYYDE